MSSPMFRRLYFLILVSFLLTNASLAADQTGDNAPHFSQDAKALYATASAVAAPDGTDIVVLEDQETIIFDAEGRGVHTTYTLFKVLTQRGAESWSDVSNAWEPWHEERPALRARVITPDFAVRELDPKTLSDAPSRQDSSDMYSDSRVMRAPLPAMAPGSLVEQEWVEKETAPIFGAGSVGRFYFGRINVPVQHSRLVLEAPSSVALRYTMELLPELHPERTEADGKVKVVFDHGPMLAQENSDTNLPSDVPAFPVVTFSTGASWQRIADEYAKTVDSHVGGADVKALVDELTQGKSSRDDKTRTILEYLDKNVRYTGIEFGEAAIVPHAPTETLAHKYGDCKDKATLLVAMLRAAGIPAYVALLNAGQRNDVAPELPGMGLFDHAIVYVPGDPDLWIDATDDYARLGQLPLGDQGRLSLVVRAGSDSLVRIPTSSSQSNVLLELREIDLAENGPARVMETSQPQGCFESEFRRFYADKDNKDHRESLSNYVKSQYLADKLDRFDRSDPTDFSKQFELVLETKKAKRGYTDLDDAVAAIRLEGLFSRLPDELQRRESSDDTSADPKPKKKRTADYQLPEPLVVEWHYTIVPPLGFQAKPLPQDVSIAIGPAVLTEHFSAGNDGNVSGVIRFDTVKRRLTVAESTEMRNKIAEIRQGEAVLIHFEPVAQTLLNQGKAREAFQNYRGLIAQHPKEAVHHLQIAKALLIAGLGEAARNEARLAVKLEPKSALAEKTLGEILEFDLVGRMFRPGSDYAGSAAAFRAAMQLDPDEKDATQELAILLEYNEDGARYATGAKLKEAVQVYRSLPPDKLVSMGLQNNVAFALFYSGEFAEARKLAETLNPQPKGLIVACEAATNGSESAIAEASKRSSGETEKKQIAAAAGTMLMNLRKYSLAADLVQAGAAGDNAARTMGLASLLRKAQPHEQIHFGDDPTGFVMKFFLLQLSPDLTVDQMNALGSKNAVAVMKSMTPEELEKALKAGKQFRRSMARSGSSPDVTLDIMLPAIEPKGEGNDASGYRENLVVPGGTKLTMFVVKQDGAYKVLDTTEKPNAIGLEILDRVAANHPEQARVLLDWLREEQHLAGGDDPMAGEAFPRFWTKGKDADARQMKLAGAAILVQTKATAKQGVAVLEEAKKTAATDTEKTNIDLALLQGYDVVQDFEKLLAVSVELVKQEPESRRIFFSRAWALRALGRFDEANDLAQERLKRLPDDVDSLRVLFSTAASREDYRAAHDWAQKVVDLGKAEASDFNGLAWETLFFPREGGPDIDNAIKATQLSQNSAAILHTLGCVYAEAGKTKEAREVLVQAMDILELDEPDDNYWYAFGRIAEQYGEREIAMADYHKVARPKDALQIPDSTYRLAQNRLKMLQAEAPSGGLQLAAEPALAVLRLFPPVHVPMGLNQDAHPVSLRWGLCYSQDYPIFSKV